MLNENVIVKMAWMRQEATFQISEFETELQKCGGDCLVFGVSYDGCGGCGGVMC